jgi:hypothetical protein
MPWRVNNMHSTIVTISWINLVNVSKPCKFHGCKKCLIHYVLTEANVLPYNLHGVKEMFATLHFYWSQCLFSSNLKFSIIFSRFAYIWATVVLGGLVPTCQCLKRRPERIGRNKCRHCPRAGSVAASQPVKTFSPIASQPVKTFLFPL